MKTRVYYLDHLRTFAIFLVVVLHAGIVYEPILENIWLVSDPIKNSSIGLLRMYLDLFVMYLIFFISGYFVPLSLRKKDTSQFIKSKVKRILWPWILAVLTLIPLYKVIFLYSRGLPQEEWYSYFHFFQRAGSDLGIFSNNPSQNWLWFLPVLFVFQLAYLGLTRLHLPEIKISLKTGIILALVINLIYSLSISMANLSGWHHSWFLEFQRERLIPYFLVFLLGSLCQKNQVFDGPKNKRHYLYVNILLTLSLGIFTVFALNLFFNAISPGREYFFLSSLLDRAVYYLTASIATFSFLYLLLYLFRFKFSRTNSLMSTLNRNSYSVYIIHVGVIGLLALPMLALTLPAMLKFLLLAVLAFIISNFLVAIYEYSFSKGTTNQSTAYKSQK